MHFIKRLPFQVGDFGLSRIKRNTLVSGGVRGTLPWMAPELLNGSSNRVSEKVKIMPNYFLHESFKQQSDMESMSNTHFLFLVPYIYHKAECRIP